MFSNVKGSRLRRNGRLLNPQRWIPLWVVDREIGAKLTCATKFTGLSPLLSLSALRLGLHALLVDVIIPI